MTRRRFAPVTVLTDETTILGAPVAEWKKLLTAGFADALPKDCLPEDLRNTKNTAEQIAPPISPRAAA